MFDDIQDVVQESRETRSSESTSSVFGEAYGLLQQQQPNGNDAMQAASQSALNDEFGTLDLFDSQTVREPTFNFDKPAAPLTLESGLKMVVDTYKNAPAGAVDVLKQSVDVWTHPSSTFDQISEDARRKWSELGGK